MRHGANIPDIRALSALLTSITNTIEAALPTTVAERGVIGLPINKTIRVLQPDAVEATFYNPSAGVVEITEGPGQRGIQINQGEGVTLSLNAGSPVYATGREKTATLCVEAKRSITGTLTFSLENKTTLSGVNGVDSLIYMLAGQVILSNCTGDYFKKYNLADNSLSDSYDAVSDLGFTPDLVKPDFLRTGRVLVTDPGNPDLYSIDVEAGTGTNVFTGSGVIDYIEVIDTPVFSGYIVFDNLQNVSVLDSGFSVVASNSYSNVNEYFSRPDFFNLSTDGRYYIFEIVIPSDTIGWVDLQTFTFGSHAVDRGAGFSAGIAFVADGKVYYRDEDNDRLFRSHDIQTGATEDIYVPAGTGFYGGVEELLALTVSTPDTSFYYRPAGNVFSEQPRDVRGIYFDPSIAYVSEAFSGDPIQFRGILDGRLLAEITTEDLGLREITGYDPYTGKYVAQDANASDEYVSFDLVIDWDPTGNL